MNKNILIIALTIVGIIIIITLATLLKIKENRISSKYDFIIDNFIYFSKKCVEEEKCTDNVVTLKELYKNKYIEKEINPKTNEYFNDKSYIKILDYSFVIVE